MSEEEKVEESFEKSEVESKKHSNKELYIILGGMIVLILVFTATSLVFKSFGTFEYEGLAFTKERFGDLQVYHYYYYITSHITGNVIAKYNLYLTLDPRENNVPVEGEIEFEPGEFIYVSIDGDELTQCGSSSAGLGSLSAFLTDNQLDPVGSVTNETLAKELGVKYATCESKPERAVIVISTGNETKITRREGRCYNIEVANCEIVQAVEKFELRTLIDARKRAGL